MAATSAESAVYSQFTQNNKPFSEKNLIDLLAHAGHKKAAINKALDSLVESGKIVVKEFGKTKIFIPNQASLPLLDKEQYEANKTTLAELTKQQQEEMAACKQLEQELNSWKNSAPVEDMQREVTLLTTQRAALQAKVAALKGGAVLVSAADREAAEKALSEGLAAWRKRKSMFRNIWASVSESLEGKKDAEMFEEMGVDTDESVGADLKALDALVNKQRPTNIQGAAKRKKL